MSTVRDEVQATGRWAFDAEVAEAFDDMLSRSIPDYQGMRALVCDLASRHLPAKDGRILDLGCSRGESIAALLDRHGVRHVFTALEISEPMLAAAQERFSGQENVEVRPHDLRTPGLPALPYDVVLSILTLQFTPIEHRQRIVADVHQALNPGGALLLVEKVMGSTAHLDATLVDAYLDFKRANGYTEEQIERKRLSLEGVLVPVTAAWNEQLLDAAGFTQVECVWRTMNFAAWIAVKT